MTVDVNEINPTSTFVSEDREASRFRPFLYLKKPEPVCLFLILGLGLLIRLSMAWTNVEVLIQKTLPDDAFYYFAIARNMAGGRGLTVDGTNPTNGFHPMWALILILPFIALRSHEGLLIPVSLTLSSLFDIGTAYLGYRAVRLATGSAPAAVVTALLYALNPLAAMESVNGLETALSTFLFALCFYYYLTAIKRSGVETVSHTYNHRQGGLPSPSIPKGDVVLLQRIAFKRYAILGALAGLMVLARTDTIFLFALMGLEMLWEARRKGWVSIIMLLIPVLAFAIVISPWLAWNQLTLGTMVQSSGVALPYLIKYSMAQAFRHLPLPAALGQHVGPILSLSFMLFWYYSGLGWTVLIVLAFSLRFYRFGSDQAGERGKGWMTIPKPFLVPLAAALISVLFHTFYRWYPRSWYYVPLAWVVSLWVGPAFAYVSRIAQGVSRRGKAFGPLLLGATLLILALQGAKAWWTGFYPWQVHMYHGALWLAEHTAPQEVIGSFNAGLNTYYSRRTVINLDGVTDWRALQALKEQRLLAYARGRGVDYIVDYRNYIDDSYVPFWGEGYPQDLYLIETLSPPYPPYGAMVVYELKPGD